MEIKNQLCENYRKIKDDCSYKVVVKLFFTIVCTLCSIVSQSQSTNPLDIKPENLKLFSEFYKSYDEVKNSTEVLVNVTNIVKKIEANEPTISEPDSNWNTLAANYKAAADKIQKTPLVTDFDKTPFMVSVAEMSNCDNKVTNINKMKAFRDALASSLSIGTAEMEKIKSYKDQIENSKKALVYLKDVHAKLVTNPLFVELFKWDWLALNTNVSSSLSTLSNAVSQQEKKLEIEITKVKRHYDNLASNITFLESNLCTSAGKYMSNEYTATANYNNGNCHWRMTFSRIRISFVISADQQVRQASITAIQDEHPTQGNCGNNPAQGDRYEYYNASLNGNTIMINFTPASSNGQKCKARLDGIIRNNQIDGVITFRRYDQPNFPSVQYTIKVNMAINKEIPNKPEL